MQENTKHPCCRAAENHITICAQQCDNASMVWHKGNEVFRCELYENAINAYDNLNEIWPFNRTIKGKGRIERNAMKITAKAPVEISKPSTQ